MKAAKYKTKIMLADVKYQAKRIKEVQPALFKEEATTVPVAKSQVEEREEENR